MKRNAFALINPLQFVRITDDFFRVLFFATANQLQFKELNRPLIPDD
jgi:hypothetical protein